MPRIRSIKPEFWHDPDMASELSRDARLLYIGLWNLCYDNWTMEYDVRNVKRELFGYDDDVTFEMVAAWVQQLEVSGRAIRFIFEGRTCLYLPKCGEHQKVNHPSTSPITLPDSVTLSEASVSTPVALRPEGRGGEGRVVGRGGDARERALSLPKCFSQEITLQGEEPQTAGSLVRQMMQNKWAVQSPADIGVFDAIVTDTCFHDCSGSEDQLSSCLETIYKAIEKANGTVHGSRGLLRKILTEDREMAK